MIILSKDSQRIEQWQSVAGIKAKVSSLLSEVESWVETTDEKVCLVDLASETDEDKKGLEQLITKYRSVGFFVFVALPDESEGVHWIKVGAQGYANRLMNDAVMEAALSSVQSGEIWASKQVVQYLLNRLQASGIAGSVTGLSLLTTREHEIADYVADGLNNKEISEKLGITERTVKAHLNKVFKKMNVNSRVKLALELGKAKQSQSEIQYN